MGRAPVDPRDLTPEGQRALETVVNANTDAVRAAFVERDFGDEVCAICLFGTPPERLDAEELREETQIDWPLSAGQASIETAQSRANKLSRAPDLEDRLMAAWNGDAYAYAYEVLEEVRTPEFIAAEAVLASEIDRHDTSERWVLDLACKALSAIPPLQAPTEDFVAFYGDFDFGPALTASLNAAATSRATELLRRQDLLWAASAT